MAEGLRITRTLDAPPERVWDAWTRPEEFAAWFGTADVPVDTVGLDVRPGGTWTADMHLPDGPVVHWTGEYLEVDPPHLLVLTMTDDPSLAARETITVALHPAGPGTEMTVTQTGGNLTAEQYEQTTVGYTRFFDDLERLLASRPTQP
jgi:uncharacterized protein YndB with AHSA1/START domain